MFLTTIYFFIEYRNLVQAIGMPHTGQLLVGAILIILVLLSTYIAWGVVIPLLVCAVSLYAFFGKYFPGILFHSGIGLPRFIGYSATYFMGTLGRLTGYSASLIIHFLIFGAVLQAIGGKEVIVKLGKIIGSRFKSGAAQSAVVASGMMGIVSGSVASNVAVTGAFTIPMMKNRGYKLEYAGAVEAAASSGGQIMPPVMGIVAFIIAGMTGIPYAHVVIAAALPALVYFLNLSFNVFVRSNKIDVQLHKDKLEMQKIDTKDKLKNIFIEHGYLLISIIILSWRIIIEEAPPRAVFWGSLSLVILGLGNLVLTRFDKLHKALLNYSHNIYKGLIKAADEASKIALILASLGIILETFTTTGFGQRLSYYIVTMGGGGSSLTLVLLVALLVLFLGMGMPTSGAYLVAILLTAPALTKMGFELFSVHMFIFYFAILSGLTPPVCLAVLVAVSISGGDFFKTALQALRLAIPGFLMPFFFLYEPVILHARTNPLGALQYNLFLLMASCGLVLTFEGYFFHKVEWVYRIICLLAALLIFYPNTLLSYLGVFIIFFILIRKMIQKNGERVMVR